MTEANFFPWEETREDNVFPTSICHMRIESLEDGTAKSSGNRMFRARFSCIAPTDLAGMSHFENYVVGTAENPQGINAGSMGTRQFKKLLAKAQVPPSNDIAQLMASGIGAEVLIQFNCYTEDSGEYKGTLRNRVVDYHRIGEREAAIAPTPGAPGAGKAPVVGQAVAPPPQPPPAPAPTPTAPAPTPPASPAAPAAAPPPPAPPAPQAETPSPPAAAPAPPQTAAPAAGTVLHCTICQQDVPVAEFGAHVQSHASQA